MEGRTRLVRLKSNGFNLGSFHLLFIFCHENKTTQVVVGVMLHPEEVKDTLP